MAPICVWAFKKWTKKWSFSPSLLSVIQMIFFLQRMAKLEGSWGHLLQPFCCLSHGAPRVRDGPQSRVPGSHVPDRGLCGKGLQTPHSWRWQSPSCALATRHKINLLGWWGHKAHSCLQQICTERSICTRFFEEQDGQQQTRQLPFFLCLISHHKWWVFHGLSHVSSPWS